MKARTKRFSVDGLNAEGKPKLITFAVEIEMPDRYNHITTAAVVDGIRHQVLRALCQSMVDSGLVAREHVQTYLGPRRPQGGVNPF